MIIFSIPCELSVGFQGILDDVNIDSGNDLVPWGT